MAKAYRGKIKERRGNRKDIYMNKSVKKAFDYIENQLLDARVRNDFSEVLRAAQREVDYWRLGVYDIDSLVYDFAARKFQALLELKAKRAVNYLDGYFVFREAQYLVTKALAERMNVPFYWIIRNFEGGLWYVTDVLKVPVQVVKEDGVKYDAQVWMDKDAFLMLTDEEFKDWIIQNVL